MNLGKEICNVADRGLRHDLLNKVEFLIVFLLQETWALYVIGKHFVALFCGYVGEVDEVGCLGLWFMLVSSAASCLGAVAFLFVAIVSTMPGFLAIETGVFGLEFGFFFFGDL